MEIEVVSNGMKVKFYNSYLKTNTNKHENMALFALNMQFLLLKLLFSKVTIFAGFFASEDFV